MIDWEQWANSPELRKSVRIILSEWGRAYRGGYPDLGYPSHQPWTTPPEEEREAKLLKSIDMDQAERTEAAVSEMVSSLGHERSGKLLVWRYVHGHDAETVCKIYNRHYRVNDPKAAILGRLDCAEWICACLL